MTDVAFYHLQTIGLEAALPQLLGKCLERDWRVVVEVGDQERISLLDEHLWTFSDTSFLPHAAEGNAHAERQPIWLAASHDNPNEASVRFYVEGAEPVEGQGLSAYQRVIVMFDGTQEERLGQARALWKSMRSAGHDMSYWKQSEDGRWQRAQ